MGELGNRGQLSEKASSTGKAMITLWDGVCSRVIEAIGKLNDEHLPLQIGSASIGYMIRHTAEVEFMFANWYFGVSIPKGVAMLTSRGPKDGKTDYGDIQSLLRFLETSHAHIKSAMQALSEQAWHTPVDSPMGSATPGEAIGRLIYHTGIHAGQISLIQKHASNVT